jgi:hypothetical protein
MLLYTFFELSADKQKLEVNAIVTRKSGQFGYIKSSLP